MSVYSDELQVSLKRLYLSFCYVPGSDYRNESIMWANNTDNAFCLPTFCCFSISGAKRRTITPEWCLKALMI